MEKARVIAKGINDVKVLIGDIEIPKISKIEFLPLEPNMQIVAKIWLSIDELDISLDHLKVIKESGYEVETEYTVLEPIKESEGSVRLVGSKGKIVLPIKYFADLVVKEGAVSE